MVSTEQLAGFRYVRDILDQPAALSNTLDGLAASAVPAVPRCRMVVLTGMGSSFHALIPLHLRLTASGIQSLRVETSELLHYMPALIAPGNLLVVVSQSGESVEVLRLLEAARGKATVVGVTNTASSPLARESQFAVETRAGGEAAVATKTYVSSLAALEWLGAALTGTDGSQALSRFRNGCDAMSKYLSAWVSHVGSLTSVVEGVDHIFLAGRGRSLASTATGGLVLKEATHFPAEGMSSAAFRHGPLEMVRPGVTVCVFAGERQTVELNRRLADDISAGGGRIAWIGRDADLDVFRVAPETPETLPLLEILPIQMLSIALARRDGREPGAFVRLTKVTTIE